MKKRILAASAVCRAGRTAIGLIDRLAEFPVRRKTIFEVAAYGPHFECQSNGLANHFRSLAMPGLQMDRHRHATLDWVPAFSRCPPNWYRIADKTLLAKSAS